MHCFRVIWLFLLVFLAVFSGCSQPTVVVEGKITLEGETVADITISFRTEDDEIYAVATTDESGHYQLSQGGEDIAIPIGEYHVAITSYVPANPDDDPPTPGHIEWIPDEFNVDSKLKRTVTETEHVFDFDIPNRAAPSEF